MVTASGSIDPADRMRASAEAAALLVRAPHTAPDDLDAWLAADPAHSPAYIRTLSMWNDLGEVMADAGASGLDEPVLSGTRTFAPPAASPRRDRRAMFAGLACLALVCLASVFWMMRAPTFGTAVGEQRIVVLRDGTRVTLNTDTEIAIDDDRQRHVSLRHGEALFEVAHDPAHPFVVTARGANVQALGTSFVVRNDHDRLDVLLLTGVVKVDQPDRVGGSIVLKPGDRLSRTGVGAVLRDRPKIEAATAWRNGELVLDDTPLSEAVAEMNRYSERPIVLKDEQVRAMRLSGVFRTRDSETFANTVGAIYGLQVSSDGSGLHIAAPRGN